jgi:hypothetical protein
VGLDETDDASGTVGDDLVHGDAGVAEDTEHLGHALQHGLASGPGAGDGVSGRLGEDAAVVDQGFDGGAVAGGGRSVEALNDGPVAFGLVMLGHGDLLW